MKFIIIDTIDEDEIYIFIDCVFVYLSKIKVEKDDGIFVKNIIMINKNFIINFVIILN